MNSADESIPDPDLLLQDMSLKSNKSMSTAADSNDLMEQDQQQQYQGKRSRGFKGSKRCGGGFKRMEPEEPKEKVVISVKPAGIVAPVANAEMF